MAFVKRDDRISQRVRDSSKENKRKSKLFYVSCDYMEVNKENEVNKKNTGYQKQNSESLASVRSDQVSILVDQNASDKQRKKINRRSKLFYVSCEHVELGAQVFKPIFVIFVC